MSRSEPIESKRDRAGLVRDAGLGRLSLVSVLAGVLVAYGAFPVRPTREHVFYGFVARPPQPVAVRVAVMGLFGACALTQRARRRSTKRGSLKLRNFHPAVMSNPRVSWECGRRP
jgi:hypothetical protein